MSPNVHMYVFCLTPPHLLSPATGNLSFKSFSIFGQASTWPSTFLPFISTDGASHWSNLDATPTPPQPFSLSLYRASAQWPCSAAFQEQCLSDHHGGPTPLFISVCVEGQWVSVCVHTVFQAVEKEVWLDRYGNLNFKKKKEEKKKDCISVFMLQSGWRYFENPRFWKSA